MSHNFFGQRRQRSLIWQLDYHPQYQFSVFAQGLTLQYSRRDGDSDHRSSFAVSLSLRTFTVFVDRVPMRWEKLYDLQVQPSLFQLSYEALRAHRLIVRNTTDRPKHQVYPDTLKYQCKLSVRRDIEERRKQIHAVILVHMQFIKTTHCNQTPRVLLRCPYSSGVMHFMIHQRWLRTQRVV